VVVHRVPKGNDEFAENGFQLRQGDKLRVADDASITLAWSDGTRVQLSGGTVIDLPSTTAGKLVYLDRGDLAASVAKQPANHPMIFKTPHADAIVRGTELSLHVHEDDTRLDVSEGQVELVEHQTHDAQLVVGWESATATAGAKVVKDSIRWPTSDQGLVYLFSGNQRSTLVRRNARLWPTKLTGSGEGAEFNAAGEIELNGGWFVDTQGAADVANQVHSSGTMSLEVVLTASSQVDDQPRAIMAWLGADGVACTLTQAGQRLVFQIAGQAPVEFATLSTSGARIHLAITCNGNQLQAYLDGQSTGEFAFAGPLPANATRLTLGSADGTACWQGRIAGLAIYDRVLTSDEISRNAAGLPN
jgi:hypothetical protein